jgi:hypothetical protein
MTEPLAALLLLGAGLGALHYRGRPQAVVVSGLLLGLATLVRPSSLLAGPLLLFTQPRPYWQAALRALAASALALVVVLPWTLRNCARMDGCALVSTNGGWNLAIGAITETGRFQTLRAKDGCAVVTGQVQQDDCWAKIGRAKILKDPKHWLGLAPLKLSQTFDHESFAVEYLHEADPARWPEDRRVAARELLTAFHRAILIVSAFGVVAWPLFDRKNKQALYTQSALAAVFAGLSLLALLSDAHPFYWLAVLPPIVGFCRLPGGSAQGPAGGYLLGLVLATVFTHVLFFGEDRYHLVVAPIFCLLAAGALRSPESTGGAATGSSLPAPAPG